MSDLNEVLARFRKSVGWEPRRIERKQTECGVCGHLFVGVVCPRCGYDVSKKDEKAEPTILQKFVRSLRERGPQRVEKSVDLVGDLQTCVHCGGKFEWEKEVCVHCGKSVPPVSERFLRSLRK